MDKLQEAAELHRRMHDAEPSAIIDFKKGAQYQSEIDKEAIQELVSALEESNLQIKYLHDKFQPTGTGITIMFKNLTLIQKHK